METARLAASISANVNREVPPAVSSTSFAYHALGLRKHKYRKTVFGRGAIEFHVERKANSLSCSACGSRRVRPAGQVQRRFRSVPVGSAPVFIVLPVPRLLCQECGKTRQAKLDIAGERQRHTRQFARFVLELLAFATIQAVARHLGVGWDLIKGIQKERLERRFSNPPLKGLERIAIDEIFLGKGLGYRTLVLDLDSGRVVFVGQGRDAKALEPFWKRLKRSKARVKAVATDMAPAFVKAVAENLPKALHVFDRFHVAKLFNEKLSNLRRQLHRQANSDQEKAALKGTRWLLLKNADNLEPGRNERERLEAALEMNKPLAAAYYMKESLRLLWQHEDAGQAASFLDDWIGQARASGVKMLAKMADTLDKRRQGLLNWYAARISTGPLEGTNNKIKTMLRQSYGLRDEHFLRLKILALHQASYAFVG